MKFKTKITVEQTLSEEQVEGFNNIIKSPFLLMRTKQRIHDLPEILNIEYFYKGTIQVDENEIEGVKAILDKIQKYQSGKMSEKETNKMSNKLREYPVFESIVVSFEKGEALSDEQIEVLSSNTSIKTKSINYNDLILNAESLLKELSGHDYILDLEDKESLFPQHVLIELVEEELKKQKKELIAKIMGKPEGKKGNKKTMIDYLNEKRRQVESGTEVVYSVEGLSTFPQANDLGKVLDLGEAISKTLDDKIDMEVLANDNHIRDVHYYVSALKYLGLVYTDDKSVCLSYAGESFFAHDRQGQKVIVLDILSKDDLVNKIFHETQDISQLEEDFNRRGLSGETIKRRISSILSWKRYLID